MTIRTRTIRHFFDTEETAQTTGVRYDFGASTIYIPMTGSRAFRSVALEVRAVRPSGTGSITSRMVGIKLGAVAFDDLTTTVTITQQGESESHCWRRDVTSYFTANFGAGASQTCQVGVEYAGSASDLINISACLVITFDYDDAHASASTRVKTVPIVLESLTGVLSTTLQSIGTTQIPDLDAVLGESSKVYRQIAFDIFGNNAAASAGATVLEVALDAEAGVAFGGNGTQASGMHIHHHWVRNDMDPSVSHDFKARDTTTASRWPNLSVVLWVTYEYDHDASTRVTVNQRLPVIFPENLGLAAAPSLAYPVAQIQEPGTITAVNLGLVLWRSGGTSAPTNDLAIGVGSQTPRVYDSPAASSQVGAYSYTHRFDSGSDAGSGITLARGANRIECQAYQAVDNVQGSEVMGLSGWCSVTYTADMPADGDGVIAETTEVTAIVYNPTTLNLFQAAADVATLAHVEDLRICALGVETEYFTRASSSAATINAETLAGEEGATGRCMSVPHRFQATAENSLVRSLGQWPQGELRRWPDDPARGRFVDVHETREWRGLWAGTALTSLAYAYVTLFVTAHGISYTGTGTGEDLTGDGSGATVEVWSEDNDKVAEATTVAGGGFTFTYYDDTIDYFTTCHQGSNAGASQKG
jgi:hypothetical protein